MSEVTDFSRLVGEIYDATLDPSLWRPVLRKICAFVPSVSGHIFIQDANNRYANAIFDWGIDPVYFQSYLEKYARLNPFFPAAFFCEEGKIFSGYDIVPQAQFRRTRFYREWVEPQGVSNTLGAILDKSATSCAVLSLPQARDSPLSEAILARARLVVPHIRRAVLIGKAFDLQKAAVADFAATVDALAGAIFLLDAQGRVVHANRGALALLAVDDVLYGTASRLRAHDRLADHSLSELLVAAASGDDLAIGSRGAAIHLPARGGGNYVGHVLPLATGARRAAGAPLRAAAALVVHDAARNPASPPEVLAKAFGLTPREVAVLLAIADASGVAEAAERLGLSKTTIRAHLRHLFAKTGARRQAELVKLVAKFMSPVA